MADLANAEKLTRRALDLARSIGDVDLELIAASQLGLIDVGRGHVSSGLAQIDEAMAAVLGGEACNLDTVVYTCCDMLNACELAGDAERAAQWCKVADQFVASIRLPVPLRRMSHPLRRRADGDRPMGRSRAAAHHRRAGDPRRVPGTPPSRADPLGQPPHPPRTARGRRAVARRCRRRRRGGERRDPVCSRVDARARRRRRCQSPARAPLAHAGQTSVRQAAALDVLVDAHLAAGDVAAAAAAAARLVAIADSAGEVLAAIATAASGRVAAGAGDAGAAVDHLEDAASRFADLGMPFETARARDALARVLAHSLPDLAVAHARAALDGFTKLGAALDADRVAAFLRAHGVVARTGPKGVGALDQPRAGGAAPARPRTLQSGDRQPPLRQPQDGCPPREQHSRQARRRQSRSRRGLRPRRPGVTLDDLEVGSQWVT